MLISECLTAEPVEGAQVVAGMLARSLRPEAVVCRDGVQREPGWRPLLSGRGLQLRVLREVRRRRPASVVLLPDGGYNLVLVIRLVLLRLVAPRAELRVLLLQLGRRPSRPVLRLAGPRLVAVAANEADRDALLAADVRTEMLDVAADDERLARCTPQEARDRLAIPPDETVFLHVGHCTPGRNLLALGPLADAGLLLLVMSPYTAYAPETLPADPRVRVVHGRVEVADYYRAADVYVFPTVDRSATIGVPLSIVEALANDVPVVARRSFLTMRWEDDPRVTLVDDDRELVEAAEAVAVARRKRE
jgi:glycosyltransferase involved in cell wall biosynthesis